MIVRSHRKLALLSCVAFVCILAIWQQSPWTTVEVYEQLPLFKNAKQKPIPNDEEAPKTWGGKPAIPDVVDPELVAGGTGSLEPQEPLEAKKATPPWVTTSPSNASRADFRPPPPLPTDMKDYMRELLKWDRPSWEGHWPPFADYVEKDYDPNRWEQFDMDYRIYDAGHDKLNGSIASNSVAYKPLPRYNSKAWKRKWMGEYVACDGPRGFPLNISTDDEVQVYRGVPASFPKAFAGGYDIVGLDDNVCFDRYSRYGAYGLGDDEFPENVKDWRAPEMVPEWSKVRWGKLQDDCLERNKNRYRPGARTPSQKILNPVLPDSAPASQTESGRTRLENRDTREPKYHHRTALLIRAWTGYKYETNDIIAIRAMVSELALQSGGEYQVFLYVHVKDSSIPIFTNQTLYNETLTENVPEELRDIAILWSESTFPTWYPNVGDWQVYWQQFMCVQQFSITHPEFDYVWNWETDARYIGHHYHFIEKVSEFTAKQPRKLLWERNKRYYLPSVHGSYQSFVESTHKDVLNASAHSLIPPPVWGARPWAHANPPQIPLGPPPPHSFESDNFEWGVNEPADFITLLPIWDPRNTSWSYKDKIWNYIPGIRPIFTPEDGAADAFTHPDFEQIDRRVFINTVVRFSKRMLQAMHNENLAGRSMQAEMWPSTVALQHGLKAVYAPHPIFSDREWPAAYISSIFDTASTVDPVTGGAVNEVQGAWTEQADSPYNHDREANFGGWSWYFSSRFPRTLYRRWLGWEVVRQEWGEGERVVSGDGEEEGERMCVPGMLLHPVKGMGRERMKI
ncbi:hypothetical protein K458DRAFT_365715 [Lentithecium fluviatile CBS 122367]|uniref:Glycosyltransferase family 90 protein n=1 Tax=Lentithecium fluviatile CBS 122367 TaxID=1168545 RepID=A0A6G1J495_9PLEO|nr:hypothetical protein K458DRAFT_365715 [Lentithecium fluviatile CBS 122367]